MSTTFSNKWNREGNLSCLIALRIAVALTSLGNFSLRPYLPPTPSGTDFRARLCSLLINSETQVQRPAHMSGALHGRDTDKPL